jgi:hypothetical protein
MRASMRIYARDEVAVRMCAEVFALWFETYDDEV